MNYLYKITLMCALISCWGLTPLQAQSADGIMTEYPEEKAEIMQTWNEIVESIKDGDVDKLISFHAYGPKFTEFKQGAPRNGGEENEAFERGVFGSVQEVVKMDGNNMKIAIYHGNVAVVTFHSDFHLKFEEDQAVINDQISLVFAKNDAGEWKIVHEHHSPLSQS
ncbi:YybH family protein [Fodinibius salsisoli]|uniref:Nuclear transport factor 2 family protein n=1 Tax=Fodinibius salsisoli TaxID=2820877 RepID=A0ABT3PSX7_9BACT|nr:nuclear transport factor 2 family protein [Fodinibius salsisoli]MCW9708958.1 nuclear transport factor 2 family protein [Fodinibius salsisoli]